MSATLKKCACGICFISDTEDKSVVCHICKEERKNAIQSSARKIPNWNYLGNEPMTKREQIAAQKAAEEAAQAKAAAEAAKAARAPDKAKVKGIAATVRAISFPSVSTPEAEKVLADIQAKAESFAKWIETQAATL